MRFLWFVLVSGALCMGAAHGRNPETSDYYLITAGPSEGLHTQGGHSLLRVVDQSTGEDKVYNWGTFDFDEPNFELHFYQGSLLYRMMVLPTRRWLAHDQRRNPRFTVQDHLQLTTQQKQKLEEQLRWWEQPQNNGYLYHIWADNCSTKVRDILNIALDQKIYQLYSQKPVHKTYRQLWVETFSHWSSIVFGVNMTLNGQADLPVSEWERMFIPEYMRLSLLSMPAIDDQGSFLTQPLLMPPPERLANTPPELGPYKPWELWISVMWAFGTLVFGLLCFKKWNRVAQYVLPALTLSWAIPSGVFGSVFLMNSLFTSREYLFLPPSLWLFWPVDFLFLLAIPSWIKGRLPHHSRGFGKALFLLCRAHMASHCIYLGFWLLHWIDADIQGVATTMAPASLLVIAAIDRLGLRYRHNQPSPEILAKIKEAQNELGS